MADMRAKGRRVGVNANEANGRAKLTMGAARDIRLARQQGALLRDLAATYGVGLSTISRACRMETWK
jgi:hypothetical protein